MRGPLRQLGEPQRQVGGILGAKYETGLRLKGASLRVKWDKPDWDRLGQFEAESGDFDIAMGQMEADTPILILK